MLHTCVRRFDVTDTVEIFLRTKQDLNNTKMHNSLMCICWQHTSLIGYTYNVVIHIYIYIYTYTYIYIYIYITSIYVLVALVFLTRPPLVLVIWLLLLPTYIEEAASVSLQSVSNQVMNSNKRRRTKQIRAKIHRWRKGC